jgi:hypothetical protein
MQLIVIGISIRRVQYHGRVMYNESENKMVISTSAIESNGQRIVENKI